MNKDGYIKNLSVAVPAEQYEILKAISEMYALPIHRLVKKGIGLVIEQYMEKGEIDKEKDIEKEDDNWNGSRKPSES